ncbi:MAG TPA: saccharopine dehydrogenase C-terminal domain-containing protein [Bacteroidia bacterium]|nr:saccharopine dehydrogenase C-terminal domain-containing protein [Bacteroidia bacterium]
MKKVIVLGAGLIGKTIAIDLSRKYDVSCADIQMCALEALSPKFNVTVIPCDLRDKIALNALVKDYDLVIGAVPGFMGFEILKTVIEAGKNVVDISFFPENPFELDALAKKNNVIAVTDCGVAPGLCNIFAGYHHAQEKIIGYECLVGGLPVVREWPFEYKAVFSPADVIEEYTRPANYVENGKPVVKEALSEIEKVVFNEIGELEAFNTDGLRTLAHTMSEVPNMKEKTLRYAGHAGLMKIFHETGLFSKTPVEIKGVSITPLEFTSKLLFPKWKLKPGEEDFTIMRVTIETEKENIIYTLLDRFDKTTNTTSMARTTGYTCTAVAGLILEGKYLRKGISPSEFVGEEKNCYEDVMKYLGERNVVCKKEVITKKELVTI